MAYQGGYGGGYDQSGYEQQSNYEQSGYDDQYDQGPQGGYDQQQGYEGQSGYEERSGYDDPGNYGAPEHHGGGLESYGNEPGRGGEGGYDDRRGDEEGYDDQGGRRPGGRDDGQGGWGEGEKGGRDDDRDGDGRRGQGGQDSLHDGSCEEWEKLSAVAKQCVRKVSGGQGRKEDEEEVFSITMRSLSSVGAKEQNEQCRKRFEMLAQAGEAGMDQGYQKLERGGRQKEEVLETEVTVKVHEIVRNGHPQCLQMLLEDAERDAVRYWRVDESGQYPHEPLAVHCRTGGADWVCAVLPDHKCGHIPRTGGRGGGGGRQDDMGMKGRGNNDDGMLKGGYGGGPGRERPTAGGQSGRSSRQGPWR